MKTFGGKLSALFSSLSRIAHWQTGENDDDFLANDRHLPPINNMPEKIDMQVPDRIVVMGQEQHIGVKAPLRELQLENSVMPPDPGIVRVQTPPRSIKLEEHSFPAAYYEEEQDMSLPLVEMAKPNGHLVPVQKSFNVSVSPSTTSMSVPHRDSCSCLRHFPSNFSIISQLGYHPVPIPWDEAGDRTGQWVWDQSPPLTEASLGGGDEIRHLRAQVAKLNRRIMSVELDNLQRQQRERILYALGLAYFVLKTLLWLNRS